MAYQRIYADIDLNAIKHNIFEIRKHTAANVKIMPVIKADGYGHGAVMVAKALDDYVDYFSVAIYEEAMELRRAGVKKPILILGYVSPCYYAELIENNITLTVFRLDMAEKISSAAVSVNRTAKIHIKVDTGMTRLGFDVDGASTDIVKEISALPNIEIEGVFTHFATADEANPDYSNKQFSLFTEFTEKLEKMGINVPIKHICNSAGILQFPERHLDMVRAGILTYGLYPSDFVDKSKLSLKPALSLKTHVVNIRKVSKGTSISYGRTYTPDRDIVVATIPVGYADGYPRVLSNRGRVLIKGKYAPIIGRICMDQIMVDITSIPGTEIDDSVTLIGYDGDKYISADEIASLSGTINYEIICQIGKRIPRNYVE